MGDSQSVALVNPSHGKDRVRIACVKRQRDGKHDFVELTVTIELHGGSTESFTRGDNSNVVATDTCRNHVYLHAKTTAFSSPEHFALTLAARFLRIYSHLITVRISAVERPWRRYIRNGAQHSHGFVLQGDGTRSCKVVADRTTAQLTSALTGLSVLKATQSGFAGFIRDSYTTLTETDERILATTIEAQWHHTPNTITALASMDFDANHNNIRDALLSTFMGPAISGVYSAALQQTLHEMGTAALQLSPHVSSIMLSLPNLHFLPCNLPVMQKNNQLFQDDVYIPSAEPHGTISATIARQRSAKL